MTSSAGAQARLLSGRYRLGEALGRGGMGTVWRGLDEILGREVAVKEVVYPPTLPDSERSALRERTLREARAIARLSHSSVVSVYDVVQEDDRPWIVMELVQGRNLQAVVDTEGPLEPTRVAKIGLDLLGALEAAHGSGILHRDVKPGNVLLSDEGRVVLTDFGIAAVEGDPSLTSTGLVLGSPAYMSPERARGEVPGPASDLWALGATLYMAVEGRPPYARETPLATLTAVVTEQPDPPRSAGPLTRALGAVLVTDPRARADARTTRALLQGAARGEDPGPPPEMAGTESVTAGTPAQTSSAYWAQPADAPDGDPTTTRGSTDPFPAQAVEPRAEWPALRVVVIAVVVLVVASALGYWLAGALG